MHTGFLCPKFDNFACLHTSQDQNELHLKRWLIFCQNRSGWYLIFCWIALAFLTDFNLDGIDVIRFWVIECGILSHSSSSAATFLWFLSMLVEFEFIITHILHGCDAHYRRQFNISWTCCYWYSGHTIAGLLSILSNSMWAVFQNVFFSKFFFYIFTLIRYVLMCLYKYLYSSLN